ncbi:MAG: extracellular solute-binding protein [Clostridia bacterium]|nr:extracellular solute-binding protein [Clostridia bacterium]
MKKQIFALLLAFLLIVPIVACASDDTPSTVNTGDSAATTDSPTATTEPPKTEPAYKPELPEVRYDGEQLVILHRDPNAQYYPEICIYAEEPTGDLINDSVYRRNSIIEEKYGIEIVSVFNDDTHTAVSIASQSQSDEYDVAFPKMMHVGTLATSGLLYNFHDLDYVDFEKPYWDSNFDEDITLYGKLYAMVSDISLQTMLDVRGILFNRDLAREYGLDDPYELVYNNEWTLDKMIEMAFAVSDDLNGDQKYDDMDQYGILTEESNYRFFVVSSGVELTSRDSDGNPVVGFMNEKTISVIEKWRAIYNDDTHAIAYEDLGNTAGASAIGSKWFYGRQLFANGQILFVQNGCGAFQEFADYGMTDEYGILPQPKYDADQKEYYHMPDNNASVMVIPSSNDDYERLGILLEDMAYYSNQTVLPAYYENVIKIRRSPVPEVAEMLEIIKNSIAYNIGLVYNIDVTSVIDLASTSGNISSTFRVGQTRINRLLKNLAETFQDLP